MKAAAFLVLLTGCLSKPAAPDDVCPSQPNGTGLQSTTSVSPTVTWPDGMQIKFGAATEHIAMPDFLSLTAPNVLAPPQTAQCGTEDQSGVALYPVFSASPTSPAPAYAISTLDRVIVGPAYSEYTVHWAREFTCGTVTARASGNTIFSLFPDGRIIRNDTITPANVTTPFHASCDCTAGNAGGFMATAYVALRRSQFGMFAPYNGPEGQVPGTGPDLTGQRGGCLVEAGANPGRLALAWDVATQIRSRLRSVGTGPDAAFVFVYDVYGGPILQANVTYGQRTTMVMSPADGPTCTELMTTATVSWPPISIGRDGGALGIVNSTPQRVHVDPTVYDGPIMIRATNGDVPAGLVVSVRLPGMAITTSPDDGVLWQREEDGRFIVWFRDEIPAGASITITPDC